MTQLERSTPAATPWRVRNHMVRFVMMPWYRSRLAVAGVKWGKGWKLFGSPVIQRHRGSSIAIGDRLSLRSSLRSNPLAPHHPVVLSTRSSEATISIGDDFGMTGGSIVAVARVQVGDRVLIGANCVITDTDFHPLHPAERNLLHAQIATAPVSIGDDVFVGMNTLILKGVSIGERSVIGSGSVVTSDVPADVIAGGNPARVIRALID